MKIVNARDARCSNSTDMRNRFRSKTLKLKSCWILDSICLESPRIDYHIFLPPSELKSEEKKFNLLSERPTARATGASRVKRLFEINFLRNINFPLELIEVIRNWWHEKRNTLRFARDKKTCQKCWNHIYQVGFMCAHRTEEKFSPTINLWIERSAWDAKRRQERFNYWIFYISYTKLEQ